MNDETEFTNKLERWLETRESPSSVGRVTEEVLAALQKTAQERPIARPLRLRVGRPPFRLLAVAATLLIATSGLTILISGGGRAPSLVQVAPTPAPTATAVPTVRPNPYPAVIQRINLGGATWQVLGTPGRIWVQSDDVGVTIIDPVTGDVVGTVPGGHSMFLDGEELWVQKGGERVLVRVDPETGQELERFEDIPGSYVAKDGDLVWSLVGDPPTVVVTNLSTGEVVASIDVPAEPKQIVFAGGSVWVACDNSGVLVRIDPDTYELVDTVEVGAGPVELELGFESLWVRNRIGELVRVDPETGTVLVHIDGFAVSPSLGLSFGGGLVWASAPVSIAGVDPLTNEIVRDIRLPGTVFMDSFWVDGSLWVTTASPIVLQVDAGSP
jgi:virginiamycin B lyase